jgi:hypothetical protein
MLTQGIGFYADVQLDSHYRKQGPRGRPASTMTNQDGDFAFTAIQPGSYRFGTYKLGFFPTLGVGMPLVTLAVRVNR